MGFVPWLTLFLFLVPVLLGLVGTWLPAFGYLPALGGTGLSPEPWQRLFADPSLPGALLLTVTTGFLSALLALVLAMSVLAAWHGTRLLRAVRRFLAPLLAVPHAALALGLAFLLADSGWLVRLAFAAGELMGLAVPRRPPMLGLANDPNGIALTFGLALKETPFLLLMSLAALGQIRVERTLAVARSAGYGPVTAWVKTVLPQLYPQIRLPVYAVLAYSLSVVDMALILGPSTPPTLAVLVLRWFNDPDLSLRFMAAAGATLQLCIVLAALALWYGAERLVVRCCRPWLSAGGRGGPGRATRGVSGLAIGLAGAMFAAAILAMAVWSVTRRWRFPDALPAQWSAATWAETLPVLAWPAWTTLWAGLAAAGLALVLTIGCLEYEDRAGVRPSTRALWLLYVPLLVPQIAFLFGAQVLLVLLRLDGTAPALIWSHLMFVLPYVFLALSDPWRALDSRYARTARCLGLSPGAVLLRVKLPMLLRPLLIAAAIGFAVSVAQYLPTIFAGAGRLTTLTVEAVGLAGGGDRRVIGMYAFAQSVLPLAAFALALAVPTMLYRRRKGMSP
ncbi:MAG: ABC transporter permease subunit [Alphaproteobacteria bacterium]|jgi:putative thiamine transport system permease protein|nr:ABC transporter permease subunit [Alphaproteobacteria bacterium]